jgi:hypothetical protein
MVVCPLRFHNERPFLGRHLHQMILDNRLTVADEETEDHHDDGE